MRAGWPLWRLHIGSAPPGASFARTPGAARPPAAAHAGEAGLPPSPLWARVSPGPVEDLDASPKGGKEGDPPPGSGRGSGGHTGGTRQRTVARHAATPSASTWAMPESSMATSGVQAYHTVRATG